MRLSIGKLSTKTGVNIETIRYYERESLMPAPFRTDGGHRIYDEAHMNRLTFIRRCRDLGFPIEDIRSLLGMADKDEHCASLRPLAQSHLKLVQAKISALHEMEGALKGILDGCEDCSAPECTISTALYGCAARSCACCGRSDITPVT
ncbi:MerR family transcriptional regulator [Kordiimonas pumila]|uniref:Helix-turn-helix domain-containing protein n=1 Tax=Kordiimonas pumila TaxID=2161677 RepID=A0ABV7D193_9PROT|nr:helix-turn-helix domain-containing protein [Kordiimonas pumila]